MPFINHEELRGRPLVEQEFIGKKDDLGFFDVIGDAFKVNNTVSALLNKRDTEFKGGQAPGFNPIKRALSDQIPSKDLDLFIYAENEQEYIKAKTDYKKERQSNQRIAEAGLSGFAANLVATAVSPESLIGGLGIAKIVAKGGTALSQAMKAGAVTGATTFSGEKLLQGSQFTREDEDVYINTIASTILAGALTGAGVKLSNGRVEKAAGRLKKMLKDTLDADEIPSFGGKSVGADYAKLTNEQLGIAKPNFKILNPVQRAVVAINQRFNPTVRLLSSNSKKAKEVFLEVADVSIEPQLVKEGHALNPSIEGLTQLRQTRYIEELVNGNNIYKEYLQNLPDGQKKLSLDDFWAEVGRSRHKRIDHEIPEINKVRSRIDKWYKDYGMELESVGLLKKGSSSGEHFNRNWNIAAIQKNRGAFKDSIRPWMKQQYMKIKDRLELEAKEITKGAKQSTRKALRAREQLQTKFNDPDSFDNYIEESMDSIINNLTKTNELGGFISTKAGSTGPLKKRTFDIPDSYVSDWLENDVRIAMDRYNRGVGPAIEFRKKFGEKKFTDISKEIIDEYDELMQNASDKQSAKLIKERERVIEDLKTIWELNEGSYKGYTGKAAGELRRAGIALKAYNYMRLLGGVVISSIADLGMPILRNGLKTTFGKGWSSALKAPFQKNKLTKTEMWSYGKAFNYHSSTRVQNLWGAGDPTAYGSKFEQFIGKLGNKSSNVFGINQWNDFGETIAGVSARFRAVKNIEDFMKKGKLTAREEEWMNFRNISKDDRKTMWEMIEKHGTKDDDEDLIPNTDLWSNKDLANKFNNAILKSVERTIIMKSSGDLPRFANNELGQILFQFQSFNFAFNNKVLISGLQNADANTLMGVAALASSGMLSVYIKNELAGREQPKTEEEWLMAGLEQSGFFGLLGYADNYANIFGVSLTGKEIHPAATTSDLLTKAAGPTGDTISKMQRLLTSTGKAAVGEGYTTKDVKAARQLLPWQNVFYLRGVFDRAEQRMGQGLPDRRSRKDKSNNESVLRR